MSTDAPAPLDASRDPPGAPESHDPEPHEPFASPLVPRPRPGYRSRARPRDISPAVKAELAAGLLRAAVGLSCLGAATLYMPVHLVTPIFSGVACVMIVTGTYSIWRVGIRERRLRAPTRVLAWALPALTLALFALTFLLGPGAFGPDWADLVDPAGAPGAAPGHSAGTVRFESAR